MQDENNQPETRSTSHLMALSWLREANERNGVLEAANKIAGEELRLQQKIIKLQRAILSKSAQIAVVVWLLAFGAGYFGWQLAQWVFS